MTVKRSDLLLVVSSQGRGVFDCLTGVWVEREPGTPEDGWYDEVRLTAAGIGPLREQLVRLSGLHGGGLSACTDDGCGVTRIAPDWPLEAIVLDPPGSSVLYEGHAEGSIKIAEDFEFRAYGYSGTGGASSLQPAITSRSWDPLESTCRHASLSIL